MVVDCSHMTVCNMLLMPARLVTGMYIGWLLSYLSSVNAPLAVDSLLLTDVDMPNRRQ